MAKVGLVAGLATAVLQGALVDGVTAAAAVAIKPAKNRADGKAISLVPGTLIATPARRIATIRLAKLTQPAKSGWGNSRLVCESQYGFVGEELGSSMASFSMNVD